MFSTIPHHTLGQNSSPRHFASTLSLQIKHGFFVLPARPQLPETAFSLCGKNPACSRAQYPAPETVPTSASRVIQHTSFVIVSAILYSSAGKLPLRVIITALSEKKISLIIVFKKYYMRNISDMFDRALSRHLPVRLRIPVVLPVINAVFHPSSR